MKRSSSYRSSPYLKVALLVALTQVMGQDAADAVRPFHGIGGSGGSRAQGFAQAFTAVADDGSALFYNPAGLAYQTHTEFNLGLNHLVAGTAGSGPNSSSISATRIGNLFVVLPGKGTKWTVALGYHSLRAFERARKLSVTASDNSILTESVIEEGQLAAGVVGFGYQLAPRLSLGASLSLIFGSNIYNDRESQTINGAEDSSTYLHIEPVYRGLGLNMGLLVTPAPNWRIGLMLRSPLSVTVKETSYDDQNPSEFTITYTTRQALSLRLGTALNMGPLLVSADLFWEDFSQVRFASSIYEDGIPIDSDINATLRENYNSAPGAAVGGELLLPGMNVKIRGGYRYRPALKRGLFEESSRQTFTAGASLLAAAGLKFDLTYSLSLWERSLAEDSVYWQAGINPLRSSAGSLTANFIVRL